MSQFTKGQRVTINCDMWRDAEVYIATLSPEGNYASVKIYIPGKEHPTIRAYRITYLKPWNE